MATKPVVIIENQGQIRRLLSLVRKREGPDTELTIVALNGAVAQELTRENLHFKMPGDYGLTEERLQEKGLAWYRSLPNHKIEDDRNIKELLTYKGLSLWWLIEQQLYCSQFAFPRVRSIVMLVVMLDRIIELEQPVVVYCADGSTLVSRILRLVGDSRNIAVIPVSSSYLSKILLRQKVRAMVYVYGLWLRMLLRKIYWVLLGRRYIPAVPPGKKKLLIFSSPAWADTHDLKSGETRKGDPFLDSVIELLKDEAQFVSVDVPTEDWGLRTMKERTKQQVAYRPLESYLDMGIIFGVLKASGRLHRHYRRLSSGESFRQSLHYNNLPLYELISPNLSLFFSRCYLTMMVAIIEVAERMVAVEAPDEITHYADLPDAGRAVMAQARLKGIPVILLQHGLFDRHGHYFNHIESDIGPNKEASAPYCPIPDKFAMSDDYTKDILVRYGKIPEADVIVTGQPRYDVIARADRLFDRGKILKRLSLDPRKKLVVWMTATHGYTLEENRRNISNVYRGLKSLEDIQLVIKLHPGENQRAPLYRKDRTFQPVIVGGSRAFTLELMNASDIVITSGFCTTGVEAIMLNRPVITVDFSGGMIPPYVESGAAVGVYESDGLAPAIVDILRSGENGQKLAQARKQFISEMGCKLDGQASQWVADIIRDMIRK